MSDIPVDIFIQVVSNDGKSFPVSLKAVQKSTVITNLLETSNIAPAKAKIRLPKIASNELEKIIAYLEHHKNDTIDLPELQHKLLRNQDPDVALFFSGLDTDSTMNLLLAGRELEISPFMMVCSQKLSEISMKTKTAEELATSLSNVDFFTAEDKEAIKEHHAQLTKDVFVKLVSNDGKTFSVSLKALQKSIVIANLIESSNIDPAKAKIRLPSVASEELQKIIVYLEYHKNNTIDVAQLRYNLIRNQEPEVEWFCSGMDAVSTKNLLNAAISLEVWPFVMICGIKLADLDMKNVSAERVDTFLANCPFYTAEEKEIIKANHAQATKKK